MREPGYRFAHPGYENRTRYPWEDHMWARTAALVGGLMLAATTINAAEINVVASTAMREILEALVPQFERDGGHKVTVSFLSGAVLPVKMKEGVQADLV